MRLSPPQFYTDKLRGHEQVRSAGKCIRVHTLMAIADGAPPSAVFGKGGFEVHHLNGIPWDNRPENLDVITTAEHNRIHQKAEKMVASRWP